MPLRDLFSRKRTCDLLVNVEGRVVERYKHFKDFLHHNRDSLKLVARLEQAYHFGSPFSMGSVKRAYEELMQSTRSLIEALNGIGRGSTENLPLSAIESIRKSLVSSTLHPLRPRRSGAAI